MQSQPSNVVTIPQASGIDNIYGDTLSITTGKHSIIVTGATGQQIAVFAIDGKALYNGTGKDKNVIPANPGIYVVKVGLTATKVYVK